MIDSTVQLFFPQLNSLFFAFLLLPAVIVFLNVEELTHLTKYLICFGVFLLEGSDLSFLGDSLEFVEGGEHGVEFN